MTRVLDGGWVWTIVGRRCQTPDGKWGVGVSGLLTSLVSNRAPQPSHAALVITPMLNVNLVGCYLYSEMTDFCYHIGPTTFNISNDSDHDIESTFVSEKYGLQIGHAVDAAGYWKFILNYAAYLARPKLLGEHQSFILQTFGIGFSYSGPTDWDIKKVQEKMDHI